MVWKHSHCVYAILPGADPAFSKRRELVHGDGACLGGGKKGVSQSAESSKKHSHHVYAVLLTKSNRMACQEFLIGDSFEQGQSLFTRNS